MTDDDVRYTREVQAAMERVAGELTKALAERDRWKVRADALAAALKGVLTEIENAFCTYPEIYSGTRLNISAQIIYAALREYDEEAGR